MPPIKKGENQGESAYAKRRHRKAERIIGATAIYSKEFRDEVQSALDSNPKRLRKLFGIADAYDKKREEFGKQYDTQMRELNEKARKIERLLSDPQGNKTVLYALRAILFELMSESGVGVESPGIAGVFYRTVAQKCSNSEEYIIRMRFRHLDALLNEPNARMARTISEFMDSSDRKTPCRDPFPEEDKTCDCPDCPPPTKPNQPKVLKLRKKLDSLEHLPENEGERFKLETDIYNLELEEQTADEWPDVIGEGGHDGSL